MIRKSMTIEGKLVTKYFKTMDDFHCWKNDLVRRLSDPSLDGEVWKPILGFSRYEASNLGRLRSLNYKMSGLTKVLSPAESGGYMKTVFLSDDGKYKPIKVHRMIMLAFVGVCPVGKEVNHMDGNKVNNRIDNLEYTTRLENIRHSIKNGLQVPFRGIEVGTSKLTEEQVINARKMKKEGGRYWGRNELAKKLGIAPKHLQNIVNNPDSVWSHV